jgi:hypothetical protein
LCNSLGTWNKSGKKLKAKNPAGSIPAQLSHDKNMTHTHTHWKIGSPNPRTHATPIRWQGENIAWVCGLDSAHEFSPAQTLQNARLIAAAPEMLAHLEMLVFGIVEGIPIPKDGAAITAARETIRKARGDA